MRNINKETNKSKKFIEILILTIAALILNILLARLSAKIHFMGFMDSLFTVALTFYAGLIPGLVAALFFNPIMGIILSLENGTQFFIYDSLYSICGMLIVLITWLLSRDKREFHYSRLFTFLYLVIITFASALASCISASLLDTFIRPLFGKPSGFGITDNFSYSFQNQNMGSFLSYFLPRIPITLLDRLICTFAGYWIYKFYSKKKEMS